MPTSFATCSAVSAESPVAIITECALALSACTTSAVSTRVAPRERQEPVEDQVALHLGPRQRIPRVAHARRLALAERSMRQRDHAHALLRERAVRRVVAARLVFRSVATISGDPFRHTQSAAPPPAPAETAATVDMRCSAEEKWLRTRIFTEGDPRHVRLGGTGRGTGGGWGFPGGVRATIRRGAPRRPPGLCPEPGP